MEDLYTRIGDIFGSIYSPAAIQAQKDYEQQQIDGLKQQLGAGRTTTLGATPNPRAKQSQKLKDGNQNQNSMSYKTIIEYSIDGKFAGNDKSTRRLSEKEVQRIISEARRDFAPAVVEVTVKQD